MEILTSEQFQAFKQGDKDAFRQIVERYHARIFRLGLRLFRCQHTAADFAQDVFIHVYEKRALYDVGRAFEPWLWRVAVNLGRSQLRRRAGRELYLGDQTPDVSVAPRSENDLLLKERRQRIWRAVGSLKYIYQETLALRFESDLSLEEIAQVQKIPLGTVKSHLNRGLKKFMEAYTAMEGGNL